jgi:hypothetical protein
MHWGSVFTPRRDLRVGRTGRNAWPLVILVAAAGCWPTSAAAMDRVTLRRDGRETTVEGRLVVEAQDGGLLLLARDGVLWAVPPDELVEHTRDDRPFEPFSAAELSRRILAELPPGFEVHQTTHYLIVYDTSRAYAQWCGSLFERLYMAFTNFWSRRGLKLAEPEFPLVAVVFADRRAYLAQSRPELGEAAESIIGYYNLRTNRMAMYDLSGLGAAGSPAGLRHFLNQPEAPRTVATIVHEATHQIAFNCGLHARYSDCPVWFSEGVAIYFETPDLGSARGWRSVGAVNQPRLARFRQYLRARPANSLRTLIATDERFHDTATALDAYAEAWALTYHLLRSRPDQYVAYLRLLAEKKPLVGDGPEKRLEEFQGVFGDIEELDAEMVRAIGRLR